MFPGNWYIIRAATDDDAADLLRLAQLDSAPPLDGRVLVGELDGTPAAALSLADDRVVADPHRPTAQLRALPTPARTGAEGVRADAVAA